MNPCRFKNLSSEYLLENLKYNENSGPRGQWGVEIDTIGKPDFINLNFFLMVEDGQINL